MALLYYMVEVLTLGWNEWYTTNGMCSVVLYEPRFYIMMLTWVTDPAARQPPVYNWAEDPTWKGNYAGSYYGLHYFHFDLEARQWTTTAPLAVLFEDACVRMAVQKNISKVQQHAQKIVYYSWLVGRHSDSPRICFGDTRNRERRWGTRMRWLEVVTKRLGRRCHISHADSTRRNSVISY